MNSDRAIPFRSDGLVNGYPLGVPTMAGEAMFARARPPWMRDALCREHPEVDFFPGKGQPTSPAKAVCGHCTVRGECLAFAQAEGIKEGVWGGLSARERRGTSRRRITLRAERSA